MLWPMLEIRSSPRHGRGLFTTEPIEEGEVLEVCPVVTLSPEDGEAIAPTTLGQYVFDWGDGHTAVAFGYVSMCNHGEPSNAEVAVEEDPPTISLTASRAIAADEEVLIDYGPDHVV